MSKNSHIRANFNRAAKQYDDFAVLQREVADRMLEKLDLVLDLKPQRILDAGSGTGYATRHLERRFKKSQIIVLDFAEQMLLQAKTQKKWLSRQQFLCADVMQLPVQAESIDLAFSNLTLQWCGDLKAALFELRRILQPGGLLTFSTLGAETLYELRQSWMAVDDQPHVNSFLDLHEIGDAMVQAGFSEPVVSVDRITLTYDNLRTVLGDLKGLGANSIVAEDSKESGKTSSHTSGLMGKSQWKTLSAAYEAFRTTEGKLPATWEVVYGHAWVAEEGWSAQPVPFSFPADL